MNAPWSNDNYNNGHPTSDISILCAALTLKRNVLQDDVVWFIHELLCSLQHSVRAAIKIFENKTR
jgi:hypothetical protein